MVSRGGVGICRQGFRDIGPLLQQTRDTISRCPCSIGCPSCVHSPKCGSGNRPIDKEAATYLVNGIFRQEPVAEEKLLPPAAVVKVENSASIKEIPHYCVFDLETQRSAQEVGGWHRASRMGISIAVLYDSREDIYFAYEEYQIGAFLEKLEEFELIVGFNNKRFDNKVLSAYGGRGIGGRPTLDLLEEVKNRLNYRLSLNSLAQSTLGIEKSGDGLQALRWYKEGAIDKIIAYCKKDVEITRDLFLFGWKNGFLLFKNKAGQKVRCPVDYGRELYL